jgi:uncharacterized protein
MLKILEEWFNNIDSAIVAYSGGVDSTLVAYVAKKVLKNRMLAITIKTPFVKNKEIEYAKNKANSLGINHRILEINLPEIIMENPYDRCYICKKHIINELKKIAKEFGYNSIIDGTNYDDIKENRLGIRAIIEENVKSPLLELKFGKKEIIELSKEIGLDNEKPSSPCLITRFPYGYKIRKEDIDMVIKAEEILEKEGFKIIRVRHFKNIAKIEVGREEISKFLQEGLRERILKEFKGIGYKIVTLDLEGYISGKMDFNTEYLNHLYLTK